MKRTKIIGYGVLFAVCVWLQSFQVQAGTVYDSPYVTFSPDGQAWTTDAGNQNVVWYEADGSDDVITGISSTLTLKKGEHLYEIQRTGIIPVGKWTVRMSSVNCCHNLYPEGKDYHGVKFEKRVCLQPHYSGWWPICADCGEEISQNNFYMSKEAAASIDHLEIGKHLCYYYLCPFNNNLEQGIYISSHKCKAISANKYRVEYLANTMEVYGGYMQPSFHIYDNAVMYEGRAVTPKKNLNKNKYHRIGWEFTGWNTKPDGSGKSFEDGAEILNLCTEDYQLDKAHGNIKLYAMWRPSSCTLEIDPAGGTYMGTANITTITQDYGSSYSIASDKLKPPSGCTVSFDTKGGNAISPITGTMHFTGWEQRNPFKGEFKNNIYTFSAVDNNADRIVAKYEGDAVTLPQPVRANRSFAGWYYDEQYTRPAGRAGDKIVPPGNLTVYAQWVELTLTATNNYNVYGGAGAVDLKWSQNDGQNKVYKLYQKRSGEDWKPINTKQDIGGKLSVTKQYDYSGKEEKFTVSHTGFYTLTAYGAQGGNYESYSGGAGGKVTGSFWLTKDEVLTICVGGQNGYNGGGAGDPYGNGGGCTTVKSNKQGTLLIAGGGGGAAPNGNGFDGGLSQSLVDAGMTGESGGSGGGGGLLGGKAGELIVHNHEEGVCNHLHKGKKSKKGGCYTVPVICKKTLNHVYTNTENWTWGGSDTLYCPNCGADATKGETCSGHSTDYYDHICPVHGKLEHNSSADTPASCSKIAEYKLGCGKTEEYTCGYPYDGYVISSKSAYGGSSYINQTVASNYSSKAGERKGNGVFVLESTDIGYQNDLYLNGVSATDRQAPEKISMQSVRKNWATKDSITVSWEEPKDNGTEYFHRVESFTAGNQTKLCDSNITSNILVSGIKGYYYSIDNSAYTEPGAANGKFISVKYATVTLTDRQQYLHVRPIDVAGNMNGAIHIPIGSKDTGDDDVAWPIYTEQMKLAEGDNVYAVPTAKTYYVKSDGRTPFYMDIRAYMSGYATENYQIDRLIMASGAKKGGTTQSSFIVPRRKIENDNIVITAEEIELEAENETYIRSDSYLRAVRSDRNNKILLTGEYLLDEDADGVTVNVVPKAGAGWKDTVIYSDPNYDNQNGLTIIGDGSAPQIRGLENLENLLLLDRREGRVQLRLSAEDRLSGVRTFSMEIHNLDNDARLQCVPDASGVISVDITEDVPVFSGDFDIEIYACDNVGNEKTVSYSTTEFDLDVKIERILEPHTPLFKKGESGVLHITTWGYAEKVEIEFPPEMVSRDESLNHVYVYELKQHYKQEEDYVFMIPINAPEADEYTVTVRAYKGDKMLEQHPAFGVMEVKGTILDDLRTRLR